MAEPAANRTTISLDGATDSRYERITSVCQRVLKTLEEDILKKAKEEVAKLTEIDLTDDDDDDTTAPKARPLPPPPKGSKQISLKPPLEKPTDQTLASVIIQANALLATTGDIIAECRYWSTRWSTAQKVFLRESWCQIMRIVRSIAELLERFVTCVAPFWKHLPDKNRYVFGFVDALRATVMPYFEDMVNMFGQWAYKMTRVHADGCVCVDRCSLFAPKWLVPARRAVVLPYIDLAD